MIDSLFKYFLSRENKISTKAAIGILGIIAVLLLNDYLNFSDSYIVNNKISQIKNLNSIIKDSASDCQTVLFAVEARKKIISDSSFVDISKNYMQKLSWENKTVPHNQSKIEEKVTKPSKIRLDYKDIWLHLSSSGLIYLIGFVVGVFTFFNNKGSLISNFAIAIAVISIFVVFACFVTYFMWLIPVLSMDYLILNYILNLVLQVLLITSMVYGTRKIEKIKNEMSMY
ncbi:MAG: hypothetical protein DCE86_12340 [Flavobacteriaceae bacterium]|nr:MAG: hypothetical protein DCE86_12340 [Flavobacteriaceae bacterium]PZQ91012.1 MAG: hypothetical protein DI548_02555 [Flavobacterium johnsoniae]